MSDLRTLEIGLSPGRDRQEAFESSASVAVRRPAAVPGESGAERRECGALQRAVDMRTAVDGGRSGGGVRKERPLDTRTVKLQNDQIERDEAEREHGHRTAAEPADERPEAEAASRWSLRAVALKKSRKELGKTLKQLKS